MIGLEGVTGVLVGVGVGVCVGVGVEVGVGVGVEVEQVFQPLEQDH